MKKIVALLLSFVLALSLLTSLTGCSERNTAKSGELSISPAGEFPIVNEPVELTVWAILSSGVEDYSTNYQSEWYEEYSGVKIHWINVPAQGWADSFKTSVMGGDYPDIYLYDFSTSEVQACAQAGAVIPLNSLIDEHCPNIKRILEDSPEIKNSITSTDGNIYTLFSESYNVNAYTQKLWVNKSWLEKYTADTGKGMPQTTTDFEDMLTYFKNNDMNGNGNNSDEIPYMGTNGLDGMYNLFGAFVPSVSSNNSYGCYQLSDGTTSFAYTSEEYREALKYINGLYEKGLISDQSFTISTKDRFAYTSGKPENAKVGVVTGVTADNVVQLEKEEGTLDYSDYVAIPPLEGPNGVRTIMTFGESTFALKNAITTKCKYPEIAAKWLDYWYSEEGRLWSVNGGIEGKDWWYEETEDSKVVAHSDEALKSTNFCWRGSGVNYALQDSDFKAMGKESLATNNYLATYYANTEYSKYAQKVEWPAVVWVTGDSEEGLEYSELSKLIVDCVQLNYTDFIFGKKNIDDDKIWNEYKNKLNDIGVSRYIELVNKYKNA